MLTSWDRLIHYLDTYSATISRILALVAGIFCAFSMFGTVVEVISRYVFDYSIQGLMSGIIVIAPLAFCLGTSFVQVQHSHIRVTMVVDHLNPRIKVYIEAFSLVLGTAILALLAWLVAGDAIGSWARGQYEAGMVRIPIYPTKVLIAVSIALLCLRNLVDLLLLVNNNVKSRRPVIAS